MPRTILALKSIFLINTAVVFLLIAAMSVDLLFNHDTVVSASLMFVLDVCPEISINSLYNFNIGQ